MRNLEGILLIDDDETNNFLNQRLFSRMDLGARVKVISKAQQAYNYLYNISQNNYDPSSADYFRPDLIFLDINMPVMDGFEFLELYLKLDEKFRNQIVLCLLSTSTHPSDLKKANQYKIEFLTKPLTAEKISKLLSNYFPENTAGINQPAPGVKATPEENK